MHQDGKLAFRKLLWPYWVERSVVISPLGNQGKSTQTIFAIESLLLSKNPAKIEIVVFKSNA